jgi:diguanylate cyclase (GGDEF)-like protein
MKVLLADDDAVSRKILERTLEHSDIEVTSVGDGQSALDRLRAPGAPRIAILDWVMPHKDGPSVCREVRASTDQPYVYLILLTAKESRGDVVIGLEAGADDYLTKPCNPEELKARIRAGQRILDLQDKLIHEAQHDSLTHLPNRAFFVKCLAESVARSQQRKGYQFTLLFVDVDRFKMINDSLGHLTGDELMKQLAQRLLQAVRTEATPSRNNLHRRKSNCSSDLVARIGGDEFVVLLDDFADIGDGIRIAERIQNSLEAAFLIGGHEIFITASIGISTSGAGAADPEELLRGADTAMYKAKELGKARYEISDANDNAEAVGLFRLESDLRSAIENHEFEVHYQPIVDLQDCGIVSFEALVRWRHPELGMIQPGSFIPVAEESGLIVPIGEWVMREACRQTQLWNTGIASADPVSICVNISPRQFAMNNMVEEVSDILRETGLDPSCLELEVTENLTMQDAGRAILILRELRQLGVALSLDDFGTGYSSLSYLQRFPIRTLKIDRSFITGIESSKDSSEIVRTIIALGHTLGMMVIAEGIENGTQMILLKALGCDLGQGFLFSRPLEQHAAGVLLQARRAGETLAPGQHKRCTALACIQAA